MLNLALSKEAQIVIYESLNLVLKAGQVNTRMGAREVSVILDQLEASKDMAEYLAPNPEVKK